MPFAAIGSPTRNPGNRAVVNGEHGRALHWKLLPAHSGWEAAKDAWSLAQRAEDARLLYVGLTRARHALWLASGLFCNFDKSRSEEHTSELQSLMRISYAVFCLKTDTRNTRQTKN